MIWIGFAGKGGQMSGGEYDSYTHQRLITVDPRECNCDHAKALQLQLAKVREAVCETEREVFPRMMGGWF